MSAAAPTLRKELPPLPHRMTRLKLDHRGYPVPHFVVWLDEDENEVPPGEGRPEFRVMSQRRLAQCLKYSECWICGGKMGRWRAFVIGPMCMVNRINSEPPSHVDCADFAARACPFLSRPHMTRREGGMPEESKDAAGQPILRNPGLGTVWISDQGYPIKRTPNGVLLSLPEPSEVRFYTEGRPSTRAEVLESLESGLPLLYETCKFDGEREEIDKRMRAAEKYLPSE